MCIRDRVLAEVGLSDSHFYKSGWFYGNPEESFPPVENAEELFERVTFNISEVLWSVRISTAYALEPKITIE